MQPTPADLEPATGAYDCFVSYSRDPDASLARAVQRGLGALAKPWYRRRSLRVFLDTASLSASPQLRSSIVEGLERSRFFVLLASAEAAERPWVDREVAWWREHRDAETILIADSGAGLRWDERLGDFARDAKVPSSLRGWFPDEPGWTDLTWARSDTDVSLRNPRFRDKVAELAAPLRGMSKDSLVGEDIRQHRRSLRLAWGAAATLLLLTVAASVAAVLAVTQRHRALVQRDLARSRALAALAEATRASDPLTSLRDATRSLGIDSTEEGVRALRGTLAVPLRRVLNTTERIGGLAFTPDGRRLVQTARGGVSVWDLATGRATPAGDGRQSFVADLSLDAAGRRLASVGQVGSVNALQIADPADRSRTRTIGFKDLAAGVISPDGTTVALAGYGGALVLKDLRTGRATVLDRRAAGFLTLSFSPDGRHLLGSGQHGLRIWPTSRSGRPIDIPSTAVTTARITTVGTVVGVTGATVSTWSLAGRPLRRTPMRIGTGQSAAVASDGSRVVVGQDDGSVVVCDPVAGPCRVLGRHPGGAVTAVAFAPGNRSVASAAEGDTLIRVWDLQTGPPTPVRDGALGGPILTVSPRGNLVAAVEEEGSAIALWPRDGGPSRALPGGDAVVLAAGFTRAGHELVTVSDDGAARAVDVATGRARVLRRGLGSAAVAALSPDRRRVALAADDGPLRVFDLAGGPPVTLARRTRSLYQLRFSADGRVAAANGTRHVDVWSVRGGAPARLSAPQTIDAIDFSPSGQALSGSGGVGAGVYLWRRVDAATDPVLLGRQSHFVTALAFDPDGSGVVTAGDLDPVRLWSLDGGSGVTLASGRAGTEALAFDPSGRTLAMSDGRLLTCAACGPPSRLLARARHLERHGGLP